MPEAEPVPIDFESKLKAYFGIDDNSESSVIRSPVKPDAVVADIRSLMARGNRGYYLVKSYVLYETNAILYRACMQLNSDGLTPELSPDLESALRQNDSGLARIRIITEDHIDFSRVNNREAIARIIRGEAGFHLSGVYLVIGVADQTYKKLAKSFEYTTRP
jgi:hypothetical protein